MDHSGAHVAARLGNSLRSTSTPPRIKGLVHAQSNTRQIVRTWPILESMLRFTPSDCVRKFLTFSALCLVPVSIHAATLFSENFDELTPAFGVTSAGAFTAINGTNVDILGGTTFGFECLAPESGNCIDLGGTGGNPQGDIVSTLINIPSAGTYFLSFDLVGNSANNTTTSATVNFGPYSQSFTLGFQDTVDGIVAFAPVTFTSAGMFGLEFVDTTPGGIQDGPILDNVSVTTTSPTPEPVTGLLFGSALLVASLIRKRAVR